MHEASAALPALAANCASERVDREFQPRHVGLASLARGLGRGNPLSSCFGWTAAAQARALRLWLRTLSISAPAMRLRASARPPSPRRRPPMGYRARPCRTDCPADSRRPIAAGTRHPPASRTHSATVLSSNFRAISISERTKYWLSGFSARLAQNEPSSLRMSTLSALRLRNGRVAGAEIVDRHAAAEIAQSAGEAHRLVEIAERHRLGDLDGEPRRHFAMRLEDLGQLPEPARIGGGDAGYVEGEAALAG